MSMSQEEIEALMNGIEISDDSSSDETEEETEEETPEESDTNLDDIQALIEDNEITQSESDVEAKEDTPTTQSSTEVTEENDSADSVDDIMATIDDEISTDNEEDETNFDDILAGIDGMTDDSPAQDEVSQTETSKKQDVDEDSLKSWTDSQISQGVFPLPVEKNHKVVNQLSEVANDSEEKASRIFDVLSYILDENSAVQNSAKDFDSFLDKQIALLTALSKKFPNINSFKENLELAQSMKSKPQEIMDRLNNENNQLFEAMELMQFHDINRQKIERVMSVIRKLSNYLNNLFEDDGTHADVAVAKHIHGDNNNDLVGNDDLDSLIAEFGK